ncbi:ABC1 atypical protein kinase [Microbotryum lychnidis-dioicae p1A1 Lamole]|uniref:ABC1 atypical protein kinase n=1 Tax=Microbotryum lychnidis-dioicae (strain p1A1 Lamole / MvSl-1064) TaxID=683840 RepID=U5GZN2_USTV1|nr:ABC1 atypical protein kinase [Microbotryum lychnidis-dioicae p1A1 Lamole]|eukprot:KDE09314.1 ABC1 atypical protein kinase [Microbotryum lychnidis-dioicae p1A1 Lamole]
MLQRARATYRSLVHSLPFPSSRVRSSAGVLFSRALSRSLSRSSSSSLAVTTSSSPSRNRPTTARSRSLSTRAYHSSYRLYSSSSSSAPKHPPRSLKWPRRARNSAIVVGLGVALYAWDNTYYASALTRTARTAYVGAVMALDFKLNFNPDNATAIDALHERVAHRINDLCVTNGGLYIKLAQSLAIQAAILPKPYREAFANVFDQAPHVRFDEVVKIFEKEFIGTHPDDAFDEFSRDPIASASIAQVHRARIKRKSGEQPWKEGEGWVAVKIRKPSVVIQVEWDLMSYRALLWTYEKLFDMPVSFVSREVTARMRLEVDLANEARNAEKTAAYLEKETSLKDKVLVPKVYWDWTSEAVMTADFFDGCKLTDKKQLEQWHLSPRAVMDIANGLLGAQMFKFGWVHCDPHPGNLLVRPHPSNPRKPQLILIDHGLYIPLTEEFRLQYCLLWRSLFVGDTKTIEGIVQSWGIAKEHSEMFASMTLLRPHRLNKEKGAGAEKVDGGLKERKLGEKRKEEWGEKDRPKEVSKYEQPNGLKERLRDMLQNQEKIPKELIFLGRTARMMQANNQQLGSPSNRINSLAHWASAGLEYTASQSLRRSLTLKNVGLKTYAVETFRSLLFRVVLLFVDVGFALTQARQWFFKVVMKKDHEGFEDLLQRQISKMAKDEFGVELDEEAFAG